MHQQLIKKFLIIIVLSLFTFAGCVDNNAEKHYSAEIDALKKEIEIMKDRISKDVKMQIEIDNLKEQIEQLNTNKDKNLKASVYSFSVNEADIEVIINFNKENDIERDINFIVLSGDIKNQCISGGHNVIKYDEAIIPGKGSLGTDDVPKDVTRYRIVFPMRSDYVYCIIAVDNITGSLWKYELNSSMMGDI